MADWDKVAEEVDEIATLLQRIDDRVDRILASQQRCLAILDRILERPLPLDGDGNRGGKMKENPYLHPDWIALRDEIRKRDGGRCRNCGDPEGIEVHHLLPVAAECSPVILLTLGYRGDPAVSVSALITPPSGLLTLCAACHEALTSRRRAARYAGMPEPVPTPVALAGQRFIEPEQVAEATAMAVLKELRRFEPAEQAAIIEAQPVVRVQRAFVRD